MGDLLDRSSQECAVRARRACTSEYSEATREVSSVLVLIKDDNKSSKKYLSTPREEISYVPTKNIFVGTQDVAARRVRQEQINQNLYQS